MNNPTTQTYTSLATAFDFFNQELFSGSLPPCLITMQRHKGAYGYFSGERFASLADPKEVTDEIALIPTATSEEGGKETGQKMSHLIDENGQFAQAVAKLLAEHPAILYSDRSENDKERKKKAASKTKYTCPSCGLNAWAKPDAPLICGDCQKPMEVFLLIQTGPTLRMKRDPSVEKTITSPLLTHKPATCSSLNG